MTEQEGILLMSSSRNAGEWNKHCDIVKAAHNGAYPGWWYRSIVLSGLAARVQESWK